MPGSYGDENGKSLSKKFSWTNWVMPILGTLIAAFVLYSVDAFNDKVQRIHKIENVLRDVVKALDRQQTIIESYTELSINMKHLEKRVEGLPPDDLIRQVRENLNELKAIRSEVDRLRYTAPASVQPMP